MMHSSILYSRIGRKKFDGCMRGWMSSHEPGDVVQLQLLFPESGKEKALRLSSSVGRWVKEDLECQACFVQFGGGLSLLRWMNTFDPVLALGFVLSSKSSVWRS
ncbi:hypothetical protein R1flu_003439 [Riccia fluitans]|uniref:Uncharacterized protein n=1 Tax=Riccia fluitans TaxID=41844 RepID=A0ABD1Y912_9MARC